MKGYLIEYYKDDLEFNMTVNKNDAYKMDNVSIIGRLVVHKPLKAVPKVSKYKVGSNIGISHSDTFKYNEQCSEYLCDGTMFDAEYEGDDTYLICDVCGKERVVPNLTYHSDHPDAKLNDPDSVAMLSRDYVSMDIWEPILQRTWVPKIPKTSKSLKTLKNDLKLFGAAASAWNTRLKGLIKEIDEVKESYGKCKRLFKLFKQRKGKTWKKGVNLFSEYCYGCNIDSTVSEWIITNWEALHLYIEDKQPDWVAQTPTYKNEDGDTVEMDFDSELLETMWDLTKLGPKDHNAIGYVANMLIKSYPKCLEKLAENKEEMRPFIHDRLEWLVKYVRSIGFKHPKNQRYIKYQYLRTWAQIERAIKNNELAF